jgi:uncharacterized YccA/Bax inhibitor family protein
MSILKSGNPTLSESKFQNGEIILDGEVMTARGSVNKFFFLSLMVMASASFTWSAYYAGKDVTTWLFSSIVAGIILVIAISVKPRLAQYLAPAYGLVEGVFLGAISAIFSDAFAKQAPNIIPQAVGLTFGVVLAMFGLYRFGILKATERFKSIFLVGFFGIAVFYLITFVLRLFGVDVAMVHEGSLLGIGLSLFIVAIASMKLIIDFDQIERGAAGGAPKYMEWYAAFGLLVTIVWLYIEILRLLMKLNSRN